MINKSSSSLSTFIDRLVISYTKMKKIISFFALFSIGLIHAQYTLVPDPNFEQSLIDLNIDSDNTINGQVLTNDVAGITNLVIWGENISDLTGIQDFTNLEYLDCSINQLNTLDLRENINLKHLNCANNYISELDLSNNTLVEKLYLQNNTIGDNLNISNCINLEELTAFCHLTSLDLTANIALKKLYCGGAVDDGNDSFTELDLSNNIALESLIIYNLNLTSINLKNNNNTNLTFVEITAYYLDCFQVDNAVEANLNEGIYEQWDIDYPPLQGGFSENCFTTDLDQLNSDSLLIVFPNPSQLNVTIKLKNNYTLKNAQLFNMYGQLIFSSNSNTINLEKFPNGNYLLKIFLSNNTVLFKKIIVSHS